MRTLQRSRSPSFFQLTGGYCVNQEIKAVLFDLDGTLLDTARDFFSVINELLHEHKKSPVDFSKFRQHMAGTKDMVAFAFGKEHPEFDQLHSELEKRYLNNCTKHTCFFDGVELLLNYLDEQNIPWGIVTNKPTSTTQPVVQHFRLQHRAKCIISGDTLPSKKPDPLPLQHACKLLGVLCHQAIYVGDMHTDIEAARRAKMPSIAVSGYHPVHPKLWPASHAASYVVECIAELIEWLKSDREQPSLMSPKN